MSVLDYTVELNRIISLMEWSVGLNYILCLGLILSLVTVFLYKLIKQFYL